MFALVKHQICDDGLCQDPLLVFPGCEADTAKKFFKDAVKHKGEKTQCDPERCEALKELADALKAYPQYSRAINYMHGLAGAAPYQRYDAQPLEFVQSGGIARGGLVVARLPPRPQRPQPHNLHVRFHRPG